MATTKAKPKILEKPRLFTYEEAVKMTEAGILTEDDRVELIDGVLIEMSPIGDRHNAYVDRLNRTLVLSLGELAIVRTQGDVRLTAWNAPMPDIVVLRPRDDFYQYGGAGPEEVLLIIEVADSSLAYDLRRKATLYAEHAIPDYWVMSAPGEVIVVHRDPRPDGYRQIFEVRGDDHLSPLAFPDLVLTPNQLFGK